MRMELRFSNATSLPRDFQLEPWVGIYTIAERSTLTVAIDSPTTPILEVEFQGGMTLVIVHGPADADATVYDGERQVRAR